MNEFKKFLREVTILFLGFSSSLFSGIGLIFGISGCILKDFQESLDPWSEKNTTVENESVKD